MGLPILSGQKKQCTRRDVASKYKSWNECHRSVDKYPSALFKGFHNKEDADRFFGSLSSTIQGDPVAEHDNETESESSERRHLDCAFPTHTADDVTCRLHGSTEIETKLCELYSDSETIEETEESTNEASNFEKSLHEAIQSTSNRNAKTTAQTMIAEHLKKVEEKTQIYDSSIQLIEDKYTQLVDSRSEEKQIIDQNAQDIKKLKENIQSICENVDELSDECHNCRNYREGVLKSMDNKIIAMQTAFELQLRDRIDKVEFMMNNKIKEIEDIIQRNTIKKLTELENKYQIQIDIHRIQCEQKNEETTKQLNDLKSILSPVIDNDDWNFQKPKKSNTMKRPDREPPAVPRQSEIELHNSFPADFAEDPTDDSVREPQIDIQDGTNDSANGVNKQPNTTDQKNRIPAVQTPQMPQPMGTTSKMEANTRRVPINYVTQASKLVIGDSITKHLSVRRMFPRTPADHLRIPTVDEAVTTLSGVRSNTVDTVVCHLGINNLRNGDSPEMCIDKTSKLVNAIKTNMPNTEIILSEVLLCPADTKLGEKIREFNSLLHTLAENNKYIIIVQHGELSNSRRLYTEDGIHINRYGTAKLVGDIKQSIRKQNEPQQRDSESTTIVPPRPPYRNSRFNNYREGTSWKQGEQTWNAGHNQVI
ncbi:putative leucine-rich repeat-containing protein DDB_G0290503 [Ptychodera flava]|uniref:putative leucine-rich repeat-containing protein DDB_G0290503 n=1 Tax=Ptychodera flava TaxID=63121 RepID=UPI00396A733A